MASKGQKFRKYSYEEKMRVIKEVVGEGSSICELSTKYQINAQTIRTWVYQYRHGNRMDRARGRPKDEGDIDYKQRYEILKEFSAFLDKRHKRK
jgi:transposase-like protein